MDAQEIRALLGKSIFERAQKYRKRILQSSCTFACPAKRPVAQNMGLAKAWYMGELRKGGK